jgi:hypothetical protein
MCDQREFKERHDNYILGWYRIAKQPCEGIHYRPVPTVERFLSMTENPANRDDRLIPIGWSESKKPPKNAPKPKFDPENPLVEVVAGDGGWTLQEQDEELNAGVEMLVGVDRQARIDTLKALLAEGSITREVYQEKLASLFEDAAEKEPVPAAEHYEALCGKPYDNKRSLGAHERRCGKCLTQEVH